MTSAHDDEAGDRPLLISAADAAFARTLWQLLRSAERRRHVEGFDWVVYDLGMAPDQLAALRRRFPWCAFRSFAAARHPPHVRVARRTFAWKPVIVHEAARERRGPVFWLDAGTLLLDGLAEPLDILRRTGVVALTSLTAIGRKADPRTLEALGLPRELWHEREKIGGFFGFDTRSPAAWEIVCRWRDAALDERVIAPADPVPDHKYDQAVLSALLIGAAAAGRLSLEPVVDVDISLPRPMRWIATRNKVDPRLPTWTDPLVRAWYRTWKAGDRALIRWNGWLDRRPDGLRRVFKENFTVHLVDTATGAERAVPHPGLGYYADPFVRDDGERRWLFAEDYVAALDRGRLVAMEVFPDLSTGPARVVIDAPTHRSFPFLFEIDGVLHMIPESAEDRTVDLWRSDAMPDRWRLVRRLLWDVDMVDTVAFRRAGLWWLVGSRADPAGGRCLTVFSTDDLLAAPLRRHPVSDLGIDAGAPHGSGRNAGPTIDHDGRLLRVVQASTDHYGQGARVLELVELDAERWREVPFEGAHPIAEIVARHAPHHVSRHGSLLAYDVRDRARSWP